MARRAPISAAMREAMKSQRADRAAATIAVIRGRRDWETERREHLRALRQTMHDLGHDGTVRLAATSTPGLYQVSVDRQMGIMERLFTIDVGARASGKTPLRTATREEILEAGAKLADLSSIARRRNQAILQAGGKPSSPPAWAFIGHPVMRGVIAALVADPSTYRPLDRADWQPEVKISASVHDLRLSHTGVRLSHAGCRFSIDAANDMARIRIVGTYPDTMTAGLPGQPLSRIVAFPGLEPGTAAGDAPIRDAFQTDEALVITVSCGLEPLAAAPEGIDTAWLEEWMARHAR